MLLKILLLLAILDLSSSEQIYSLKQVLILSRHNVRTPLSETLAQMTPKSWPNWKEKSGFLTQKGALLEGFMGSFFAAWLNKKGLLPSRCPGENDIYVYANVKQRTKASAKAFINKAFPGCNVTIHHSDSYEIDPIFNPVIHNSSEIFKQIALEQMHTRLKSLQLNNSYEDITDILDYEDSELCRKDKKCDLLTDANKIINVKFGFKPNLLGPLKIGKSVIDSFIMENYEGFNVAWGQLSDANKWDTLIQLSRGYHDVIFNTTLIARDISKPLLKYMSDIFLNETTQRITLLMGHDANIYTILKGMNFKPYTLRKQYEKAPIGGKVVFQRWFDKQNGRDLLKIQYVYQSTKQMRDGMPMTLENPPEFVVLELEECAIDEEGFCLWEDFTKLLNNL